MMLLIQNKGKRLANRYMSFQLLLASLHRNIKITFQNKNKHFSYSYSLVITMIKTKNKR
jgi:hypothetical protein